MKDGVIERQGMDRVQSLEILNWRNDPLVYRWNRTNRLIPLNEHIAWFEERQLRMEGEPIFSYFCGSDHIGMTRLELVSVDIYEVSLIVNPLFRSRGFGRKILHDTCDYFSSAFSSQVKLTAVIHAENLTSQNLFVGCRFEFVREEVNFKHYIFLRD